MQNCIVAERIKKRCKEMGISVKSLLENCDINRNFMYDLERKGQIPTVDKFERIAEHLDCSVDYLLGRTDSTAYNEYNATNTFKERIENYMKHSNKRTLSKKIADICNEYDVPFEDIDLGAEAYLCYYPHVDTFYKIYDALNNKLNGYGINVFDLIYGVGSTKECIEKIYNDEDQSKDIIQKHLLKLDFCKKLNILPQKELFDSVTENLSHSPEYILYGAECDAPAADAFFEVYLQLFEENKLIIQRKTIELLDSQDNNEFPKFSLKEDGLIAAKNVEITHEAARKKHSDVEPEEK